MRNYRDLCIIFCFLFSLFNCNLPGLSAFISFWILELLGIVNVFHVAISQLYYDYDDDDVIIHNVHNWCANREERKKKIYMKVLFVSGVYFKF